MRHTSASLIVITAALLLSACGAKKSNEAAAPAAAEIADSAAKTSNAATGPGLDRAIAPGVAFQYDYAFTAPAAAITGIQRDHAAACAKLGPSRCRVTGMAYDQPREGEVSARLDFLLAPDIAQTFASDAIGVVQTAEGKLDNARVEGQNAGQAIALSQEDSAGIEAEAKRIEGRLAAKGLTAAERVELQQQLAGLRERLRGNAQDRRSSEASIATTPVSFAYVSEGLIGGKGTFGKAASASLSSVQAALTVALLLAGIALPWLALVGLIVLAWRSPWLRALRRPKAVAAQD